MMDQMQTQTTITKKNAPIAIPLGVLIAVLLGMLCLFSFGGFLAWLVVYPVLLFACFRALSALIVAAWQPTPRCVAWALAASTTTLGFIYPGWVIRPIGQESNIVRLNAILPQFEASTRASPPGLTPVLVADWSEFVSDHVFVIYDQSGRIAFAKNHPSWNDVDMALWRDCADQTKHLKDAYYVCSY